MSDDANALEEEKYRESQYQKQIEWENRCKMCGACCGSLESDPCEHLEKIEEEKYICKIYENRFGSHKTKAGKVMKCVEIRDIVFYSWPGSNHCGYKKK